MLTERVIKLGLFPAFICLFISNYGFGIELRKKDRKEAQSYNAELNSAVLNRINATVEQAISNRVTPGAVVIIGTPERTYLARAYGKLTYDADATSMTLNTLFDLASVTKVVATATATMRLIQDGRLALNDLVSKYIPGFAQPDKNKITIHHLLTHTSGLPAYASVEAVRKSADPNLPPYENLIRFISNMKLKYETGKDYTYSCLNYLTLAYINKTVLGYTQDKYLKETIYEPLGMTDTTYYVTAEQRR
ncbi:MAG: beta-lactamase family protein, partial [Candidatus Sumerlaeia bacterium]|nr:beta-lactamase family protein [Candidatus Sumerlaeia bacterium]